MSIHLMSRVWDIADPEINNSRLLVLLTLADHANDEGICWPSMPRIAQRGRVSERQAQRIIEWLVDHRYIQIVTRGNGKGHTTLYRVTLNRAKDDIAMSPNGASKGDILQRDDDSKGDILTPFDGERATSGASKGDIAMSPDPIGLVGLDQDPRADREDQEPNQTQPDPDACARVRGLLVDVGVSPPMAERLSGMDVEIATRMVFAWLPEYEAGLAKVNLLVWRLQYAETAPPLRHSDRASPLYRKHFPDDAMYDPDSTEAAKAMYPSFGNHMEAKS